MCFLVAPPLGAARRALYRGSQSTSSLPPPSAWRAPFWAQPPLAARERLPCPRSTFSPRALAARPAAVFQLYRWEHSARVCGALARAPPHTRSRSSRGRAAWRAPCWPQPGASPPTRARPPNCPVARISPPFLGQTSWAHPPRAAAPLRACANFKPAAETPRAPPNPTHPAPPDPTRPALSDPTVPRPAQRPRTAAVAAFPDPSVPRPSAAVAQATRPAPPTPRRRALLPPPPMPPAPARVRSLAGRVSFPPPHPPPPFFSAALPCLGTPTKRCASPSPLTARQRLSRPKCARPR